MPTYLLHGFRWHRTNIRVHVILQDLEEAAPEWIVAPATSISLLNSFYTLYDFLPPSNPPNQAPLSLSYNIPPIPKDEVAQPVEDPASHGLQKSKSLISLRSRSSRRKSKRPAELNVVSNTQGNANMETGTSHSQHTRNNTSGSTLETTTSVTSEKMPPFNEWSVVKLVEQYDPEDMQAVSQPYAYVGDYVVEVTLGVGITEEIAKYETKLKNEEGPLRTPGTPGTPCISGNGSSVDIDTQNFSQRELRRRSRRLGWFEKLRDGLQKGEDIGWYVVVCGDEERAAPSMEESIREGLNIGTGEDQDPKTPKSAGFRAFFRKKSIHKDDQ